MLARVIPVVMLAVIASISSFSSAQEKTYPKTQFERDRQQCISELNSRVEACREFHAPETPARHTCFVYVTNTYNSCMEAAYANAEMDTIGG